MNHKSLLPIICFLMMLPSLPSCNKGECKDVVCYNGGRCVNGECSCEEGYMGPACEEQETPSIIRISRVRVTSFPATDNGAGWDLTSGADIYVEIYKGSTLLWDSGAFIQNANPNTNHTWNVSGFVDLNDANGQYQIFLYDYDDFDPDDLIGGYTFVPYDNQNGFPSTLILNSGDVDFELEVEYTF